MKLTDTLLLILLAAIWGSSFIFMRATVDVFGPIALIAFRLLFAAVFMLLFLLPRQNNREFIANWKTLLIVGLMNSAIPFTFLAYASLSLSGGTVSILNAMTPVFTAFIAHIWLKNKMTPLQFIGMFISISGLVFLVWDKVSWSIDSWLPILAGAAATLQYGIATNFSKKYLTDVSVMTTTSGSLVFSALFMLIVLLFFIPDFSQITSIDWIYTVILGVLCTALAYIIYFKLIKSIGPSRTSSVTFLIPVFSFVWGYILLKEHVTTRMWIAMLIILFGMALVTEIINRYKNVVKPT